MNPLENKAAKEIHLKDLFRVIIKRLWLVMLITVFTTAAGWLYSEHHKTEPLYESSSHIIIDADPEYKNTLQVIMKDITVLGKVIENLQLNISPESLAGQIHVESIEDSQVVKIKVTDADPDRAADIANTTAGVFKGQIPKEIKYKNVSILSEAQINPNPINADNQNKIIFAALVVGIVFGLGFIFLIDSLDDTIKSARDIEHIGVQVLGHISKMNKKNAKNKITKKEKLEMRGETIGIK
jgi:capsular polysaccharide biosynthesis protein